MAYRLARTAGERDQATKTEERPKARCNDEEGLKTKLRYKINAQDHARPGRSAD